MLIWGGAGVGTDATGGRYDPDADTWQPTSVVNAPNGNGGGTAVWTGTEMVFWGGYERLSFGGRYDPVMDSWTPTSPSGAPAGRYDHTAVWTGSAMVVWGGCSIGECTTGSGGRYDPLLDSWLPTSTVRAPSPRAGHSAVWTGSFMIVWGPDDGGRYVLGHSVDDDGDAYDECTGDCNDSNPAIFAGATEFCDGVDNDCDGLVDEELGTTSCGTGACERTVPSCLGTTPQVCLPGTPSAETCNGVDDDCNGAVDDGFGLGTVAVSIGPAVLWPPDHRMVNVTARVDAAGACTETCDALQVSLVSIESSEPDDARGPLDGGTTRDIQGATFRTEDLAFSLRAERNWKGKGRVYRIVYEVVDCSGASSVGEAVVRVPLWR